MTEEQWLHYAAPRQLLSFLEGKLGERKAILATVACYRSVWEMIDRERSMDIDAIVPAMEQLADGDISFETFRATYERIYTTRYPPPRHFTPRLAVRHALRAEEFSADRAAERKVQVCLLKDIVGNPFRPVALDPNWRTSTVAALAEQMYESRDFSPMPVLADALQDAGCDNEDILAHCRDPEAPHVRGCWVVDLVLGKS